MVFKNTNSIWKYEVSESLAKNLEDFFSYGLLESGGYTNVTFDNAATSGYTTAKAVDGNYKRFDLYGPSLVWESGVSHDSVTPISPSGVWVDGDFYDTVSASGTAYEHYFDFKHAQVVFENALDSNSVVQAEYCMRDIDVFTTDDVQWKQITRAYQDSFEDGNFGDAIFRLSKERKLWLPSIVIDAREIKNSPLQLGGGDINSVTVYYHIYAGSPRFAKRIADRVNSQYAKSFYIYDINDAPCHLEQNGAKPTNIKTYPELAVLNGDYFLTTAYIKDSRVSNFTSDGDLGRATVVQDISLARYNSTY